MRRLPGGSWGHGACVCLGTFLLVAPAPAQISRGSIATLGPTVVTHGRSALFNWADGSWNYGEGFPKSQDSGGVISQSNPHLMARSDINVLQPWGPKQSGLWNVIAEIRPSGVATPETLGASFEIVGPDPALFTGAKTNHLVFLLSTQQTKGSENPAHKAMDPHEYPGNPEILGLWEWPFPNGPDFVNEFRTSSDPFYVFAGFIVPRTSHQPLVSSVQRIRELRQAMIMLIAEQYYVASPPMPVPTTCVCGTSFGGLTTQALLALWPDEFESGVSFAFNGNIRGGLNDQDACNFHTALLGMGDSGAGYSMRSSVDWSIFNWLEGVDFLSLSSVIRMHAGVWQRPMMLLSADEDPVTHGQDWMQLIGTPASGHEQPYARRASFTNGTNTWHVDGIVVGKACHGGAVPETHEPFLVPGSPTLSHDLYVPVRMMIRAAHDERLHVVPAQTPAEKKLTSIPSTMLAADTHDKVFQRVPARTVAQPPAPLLVEATNDHGWNRYGRGTWFGVGESLKVVKLSGDTKASIYTGSADGIIGRYQMVTVGNLQPLQLLNTSNFAGKEYSLGYGVFGLDVGEFVPGNGVLEVVAAAYRRIGVFRADNLERITTYDLPDWEHTEPKRLQIAEIYSGNSGSELVFRTLHGRVVVMGLTAGNQLTIVGEHCEAGVQDLVIGPQVPPQAQSAFTNGVWVLSARGHVAGIHLYSGSWDPKDIGLLSLASPLQYGTLWDLDVVAYDGQNRLAALCHGGPTPNASIRIFDPANLSLVAEFADIASPTFLDLNTGEAVTQRFPLPTQGAEASLAVVQGKFVTLFGKAIAVWDPGNNTALGVKDLNTFAPARGASCLQGGDVDGDGQDEVVVSTLSGRVVWFELADLTSQADPMTKITMSRSVQVVPQLPPAASPLHDHRTNAAISSTWGLAVRPGTPTSELHAISVNGDWWVVAPISGLPLTFPNRPIVLDTSGLGIDIRGLAFGGALSSQFQLSDAGGSNDTRWAIVVNPFNQGQGTTSSLLVASTPYVPTPTDLQPGLWGHAVGMAVASWDDFWLFPKGGTAAYDAAAQRWHVASWSTGFPNLAQRFTYKLPWNPNDASLWSSTKTGSGGAPEKPTFIGATFAQGAGVSLRTVSRASQMMDVQTARIGRVKPDDPTMHVVLAGIGGRVMVLDGSTGPGGGSIIAQSDDLGLGGMALATANLMGDATEEIVFASCYAPIDAVAAPSGQRAGWMRAFVHVLQFQNDRLVRVSSQPIGDPYSGDLHGYGAAGIAVADLDHPTDGVPEIIVTTLNGELVVFSQTNGMLNPTPRYRNVFDTSLGAFNSIVVGDFDPSINPPAGKPEIYIASSTGIRKFFVP